MALEKELDTTGALKLCNLTYDESGHFLIYPSMLGVKIINTFSNKLVKIIGKPENLRIMRVAMFQVSCSDCDVPIYCIYNNFPVFQGCITKSKASISIEMKASENPNLESLQPDPTLFCTAYKKNRFYLFTR